LKLQNFLSYTIYDLLVLYVLSMKLFSQFLNLLGRLLLFRD